MQDLEKNMDDLFRKAVGNYRVNPGESNWDNIVPQLNEPASPAKKKLNGRKYKGIALLLIFFMLGGGMFIKYTVYNNGTSAVIQKTPQNLRNKLGHKDFDILKLNIIPKTTNAVTNIPSSLVLSTGIDSTIASVTRKIIITDGGANCAIPSYGCYKLNGKYHDMNRVDFKIQQDATEIWEITNNSNIAHPFHIHDISFKILNKTDGVLTECDKGWKDVVLIRKGATVRLIATFADYADSVHPYMYHCHISMHEDAGMMGQFAVMPKKSKACTHPDSPLPLADTTNTIKVAPNPVSTSATILFTLVQSQKISITIFDINGRLIKTLVKIKMDSGTHQLIWNAGDEKGNAVKAGIYFLYFQGKNFSETTKLMVVKR